MTYDTEELIAEKDRRHLVHPFTEFAEFARSGSRVFSGGDGIHVVGPDGKRYMDGIGGLWCVNVGYGRREIVDAIAKQAADLPYFNTFTDMTSAPAAELAFRLSQLAPKSLNHVFFTTGGSVSNDTAIRLAHFYFKAQGRDSKRKIISRVDAYHGSTYLAASLTGITANHAGFNLLSGGPDDLVHYLSSPNVYRRPADLSEEAFCNLLVVEFETLVASLGADNIACFISEPIMGAGGVLMAPSGYHKRMLEVCRRNDILYISDEVVTAFGRLGNWFASEDNFGVVPDIITCAKGISSGYVPLGAVILSDAIFETIKTNPHYAVFSHGFTYSGHPVCCAAGLANIELIEQDNLLHHVRQYGPYFEQKLCKLKDLAIVGDVRGSHFMMSLEFVQDKDTKQSFDKTVSIGKRVARHCYDAGLIARNVGDFIILSPPLIIKEDEIDWMLSVLDSGIRKATDDLVREQIGIGKV